MGLVYNSGSPAWSSSRCRCLGRHEGPSPCPLGAGWPWSSSSAAQTAFFLAVRSFADSLFRVVRSMRYVWAWSCTVRRTAHLLSQTHAECFIFWVASPNELVQHAFGVTFPKSLDELGADCVSARAPRRTLNTGLTDE